MKHRVEVNQHTPFELSPHGYIRFHVRDDESEELIGSLEVRKDRISWRPADKELWMDLSWDRLRMGRPRLGRPRLGLLRLGLPLEWAIR